MPIVFVHGVAQRDHAAFEGVKAFLTQYVAPHMVKDPARAGDVRIVEAYWGDCAATFAWNRMSLPGAAPQVATMGAQAASPLPVVAAGLSPMTIPAPPTRRALAAMGFSSASELSRLLSTIVATDSNSETLVTSADRAHLAAALDEAAHNVLGDGKVQLTDDVLTRVVARAHAIVAETAPQTTVASQGFIGDALGAVASKAKSLLMDAGDSIGSSISQLALRYRTTINTMVTNFAGDVFVYQTERGDIKNPPPGKIVQCVLDALADARHGSVVDESEPLVVFTHSMGGQLTYDAVTYYLPNLPQYRDIRVDFWAAAASQVGLFEELKLFKVSNDGYSAAKNNKVPFPDSNHLGYWWNVWDPSDAISYTAAPVFEGVDDESFESGLAPLHAHGGYLISADFYRRFGEKMKAHARRGVPA